MPNVAGLEEVGLHVDDDGAAAARRVVVAGVGRSWTARRGRRRRLLGIGRRRLGHGEPAAGLGARRRRPLVAARLQRGEPDAMPADDSRNRRRDHPWRRAWSSAAARARRIASARSSSSGGGTYSPFEHGHSFSGRPGIGVVVRAHPHATTSPDPSVSGPRGASAPRRPADLGAGNLGSGGARRAISSAAGSAAVTSVSPTRMAS